MDSADINQIRTKRLDHLGLVAGMIDYLGITKAIDRLCGEQAKNKHLSYGQVVKCMILNGLGFVSRTLYMYSEYFEGKPIELLLGKEVTHDQVDNNVLGRALDKLFSLGVSSLFTKLALQTVKKLGLKVNSLHLDSSSFHVDGDYESLFQQGEQAVRLVPGYSRDHRPDLNQVVLLLITSNQGNLPLYMATASGNSSDKTAFAHIVKEHIKSLREAINHRYLVGDSALYTTETLQLIESQKGLFVTRVPSNIKEVKTIFSDFPDIPIDTDYSAKEHLTTYAGVKQRWVLFFSQAAYKREMRTFNKHALKGSEKEMQQFNVLKREGFSCKLDAEKALNSFKKKLKYTNIVNFEIKSTGKYKRKGKPKKGKGPDFYVYYIEGSIASDFEKRKALISSKGKFVLATNDLDSTGFPPGEILKTYKSQQSVERGFRFLKSPDFLVSSLFLKKPERIEALLMIMTLCLLVYAAIEHKIREELKLQKETFPDQLKRPTQSPTARWIFFCFHHIEIIVIGNVNKAVANLKERHDLILHLLGPPFQKFYYSEMW